MTNIFETFDFRAELFTLSPRSQTVANVARPTKRGSQLVAERDGEQLASSGSDRRRSHSLLLRMILFCFLYGHNISGQKGYTHSCQMNHQKSAKIWHIFKHLIGVPKKLSSNTHAHDMKTMISHPEPYSIKYSNFKFIIWLSSHDYCISNSVDALAKLSWIFCLHLCITHTIQRFANVFIHLEWMVLMTLKMYSSCICGLYLYLYWIQMCNIVRIVWISATTEVAFPSSRFDPASATHII